MSSCAPEAIAFITGKHIDEVENAFRYLRGEDKETAPEIVTSNISEILRILRFFNFKSYIFYKKLPFLRDVILESCYFRDTTYLVLIKNHVLVVRNGNTSENFSKGSEIVYGIFSVWPNIQGGIDV